MDELRHVTMVRWLLSIISSHIWRLQKRLVQIRTILKTHRPIRTERTSKDVKRRVLLEPRDNYHHMSKKTWRRIHLQRQMERWNSDNIWRHSTSYQKTVRNQTLRRNYARNHGMDLHKRQRCVRQSHATKHQHWLERNNGFIELNKLTILRMS